MWDEELPYSINDSPSRKCSRKDTVLTLVWLAIEFLLLIVAVNVINWVFHNPYCNFLMKCGCTWNWEGGWDECNIHDPDPNVPKCPWCAGSPSTVWMTEWGVMAAMMVAYYLVAYWSTWRKLLHCPVDIHETGRTCIPHWMGWVNLVLRFVAPFIAFGVAGFVVGLGFYLTADYPYFVFN